MKWFSRKGKHALISKQINYPLYALIAGLVIFIVLSAVMMASRSRVTSRLNYSMDSMIMAVRGNINNIVQTYEKIHLPGSDVEGKLLPEMRLHLFAAESMNNVIIDAYGAERSVLGADVFADIKNALDLLQRDIDRGKSTQEVMDAVGACMERVQNELTARFGEDDAMMPRTAST